MCCKMEQHKCKKEMGNRVGMLRAYGNGLDLSQAAGFIDAYMTRHQAVKMAENLLELMV